MINDVVSYQSADGLVKMEAIVDASNETIWATQKYEDLKRAVGLLENVFSQNLEISDTTLQEKSRATASSTFLMAPKESPMAPLSH